MGALTDTFRQQPNRDIGMLELTLEPSENEGQHIYLEPAYNFSSVANGQDNIIIGRIDIDNLREELEIRNKLFIPSPKYLVEDPEKTATPNEIQARYNRLCDENNYMKISRRHVRITKRESGYYISSMSAKGFGIRTKDGNEWIDISEGELSLEDGMTIGFGRVIDVSKASCYYFSLKLKVSLKNICVNPKDK
jgi:hypothetical protein